MVAVNAAPLACLKSLDQFPDGPDQYLQALGRRGLAPVGSRAPVQGFSPANLAIPALLAIRHPPVPSESSPAQCMALPTRQTAGAQPVPFRPPFLRMAYLYQKSIQLSNGLSSPYSDTRDRNPHGHRPLRCHNLPCHGPARHTAQHSHSSRSGLMKEI